MQARLDPVSLKEMYKYLKPVHLLVFAMLAEWRYVLEECGVQ
jgi:hypothetical protein